MKWINSTAMSGENLDFACFNLIDENNDNALYGAVTVQKDRIVWQTGKSHGTARSVGHAKKAIQTLVKVAQ